MCVSKGEKRQKRKTTHSAISIYNETQINFSPRYFSCCLRTVTVLKWKRDGIEEKAEASTEEQYRQLSAQRLAAQKMRCEKRQQDRLWSQVLLRQMRSIITWLEGARLDLLPSFVWLHISQWANFWTDWTESNTNAFPCLYSLPSSKEPLQVFLVIAELASLYQ